jgi:3',5'-cyclic AMP phosphodiesterase CpdA
MSERTLRRLRVVGAIVMALIVLYGIVAFNIYSSVGKFPSDSPLPPAHIKDIVWPTIGYPELVAPGAPMSIEIGLPVSETAPGSFKALLTPVRPELAGLSYTIPARSQKPGRSEHWPAGTRHYRDALWKADFDVPATVLPELYNLTVTVNLGPRHVTDTQPNSVSVMDPGADGGFTFVTLTDVHVHQRNISGFMAPVSDKGISPDGTPVYFQRAIDQVNLIRPDFVVMMGDYVNGQRRFDELKPEFEMFYAQLARFLVPVFIAPGNHDQYVNGVDGATVFQQSIGPLHYSFDVGSSHFTVVNTSEWPATDRTVMSKFAGLFHFPRKWQGQVLLAADERKPEKYKGELAWIRDDLVANLHADNRFVVMHHDPYRKNGRAKSWRNQRFGGVITLGGSGTGSNALRVLATRYKVNYFMTGHLHSDYTAYVGWLDKDGSTGYINQTAVSFGEGGKALAYPGYRLWEVHGKTVTGFTYLDNHHSIPFYDGSSITGRTDRDKLDRLAMTSTTRADGFRVESYLGVSLELRGLIGVFPSRQAYAATGGTVYAVMPLPSAPGKSLVYVKAAARPGVPGTSATSPGSPATTSVTL